MIQQGPRKFDYGKAVDCPSFAAVCAVVRMSGDVFGCAGFFFWMIFCPKFESASLQKFDANRRAVVGVLNPMRTITAKTGT